MSKRKLSDWASIAEIIASIAVVISLLFVAVQVRNNTAELRAAHDNDLFDSIREIEMAMISNPLTVEAYAAGWNGDRESMSDRERLIFNQYMVQSLTIWEQAYARWLDETMSDKQYLGWKLTFREYLASGMTREEWSEHKKWFPGLFEAEVDSVFDELAKSQGD